MHQLFCYSSRMVGLVQLLLKSNAANSLVEDYAACLESRAEESQNVENSSDDPGVLILQVQLGINILFILVGIHNLTVIYFVQLLIDNISRPAPNIAHLLLKFELDIPIERTVLQPKFNYRYKCILKFRCSAYSIVSVVKFVYV